MFTVVHAAVLMLMGFIKPQFSRGASLLLQAAVMFTMVHAIVLVLMMCAESGSLSSFKLWGHSLALLAPFLLVPFKNARWAVVAVLQLAIKPSCKHCWPMFVGISS